MLKSENPEFVGPATVRLVGLLFLLLAFFAAQSPAIAATKCGLVLPLTGPMASVGISVHNSILMARDDRHAADTVEYVVEDDQFVAKNTVTIVKKMLEVDGVRCLVTFGSTTSLAVVDIAESQQIPMVAIAISDKVGKGNSFVVRHYMPTFLQAEKIFEEASRRAYQSFAVLTTEQDAALALREHFLRLYNKAPVLDERMLPGDPDCRALAARVVKLNPSAIMLNLLPPQASGCSRQLRQLSYRGDFFSGPFLGNFSEVKAAGGALNGAWYATNDDSAGGEYYSRYETAHKIRPELEGFNGYDVGLLLINGIKSGDLNKYLHTVKDFTGTLGRYSAAENTFNVPATIKIAG